MVVTLPPAYILLTKYTAGTECIYISLYSIMSSISLVKYSFYKKTWCA